MIEKEAEVMLLQFRVKNFKSIANEVILDMMATSLTEHKSFLIEKNGIKILPLASIYGSNASGKSNLLDSIFSFRNNIMESATMTNESTFKVSPYLFNEMNKSMPTEFEAFFIIDEKEYRYGYSLKPDKIVGEWLYVRKLSKNKTTWRGIFERENNTIIYNSAQKYSSLMEYNHLIKDKMFVLSFFNDKPLKGIDEFTKVYKWILNCILINPITTDSERTIHLTWEMYYQNEDLKDKCVDFLQEFDETIEDLIFEQDIDKDNNPFYRAYTVHNGKRYNIGIESYGTQKLIRLYMIINLMLITSGILVIDELDCQLHPLIFRRLISMFHDKSINIKNTQIIFSSHNLIILDNDDLRRDEIWFTEKDEDGITSLYSLASFKIDSKSIRSDLDFGKHYLAGRFGAIPYI